MPFLHLTNIGVTLHLVNQENVFLNFEKPNVLYKDKQEM